MVIKFNKLNYYRLLGFYSLQIVNYFLIFHTYTPTTTYSGISNYAAKNTYVVINRAKVGPKRENVHKLRS